MKKQYQAVVITVFVLLLLQPIYGVQEVNNIYQKHEREIDELKKRQKYLYAALGVAGCVIGALFYLAYKNDVARIGLRNNMVAIRDCIACIKCSSCKELIRECVQ